MKGIEGELQQAVKKEVERRVKEELQRVQDEVQASLKGELEKLTSFGDRLQSVEDGLKEKVTRVVGRILRRLEFQTVLVDRKGEEKDAKDAPAQAVDLIVESDKLPDLPEGRGGQERGQKRSREKTKASKRAGVGERTRSKRQRNEGSEGESQQSLQTAAAALAAEQAAQAQGPASRTSSPRATAPAPEPSAAVPSRPGRSKVCLALLH